SPSRKENDPRLRSRNATTDAGTTGARLHRLKCGPKIRSCMRGLFCFGIDSCLRLMGKRWRTFRTGRHKLGPDVLPVVGAEVASRNNAISDLLNCHTVSSARNAPVVSVNPLAQLDCAN